MQANVCAVMGLFFPVIFDMKVHSCMLLRDQLASINSLLFTLKKKKKRFSDGFDMCLLYNMWLQLFLPDP